MTRDWASSDYSRLYHSVLDDPKFVTIFSDDAAWSAYTRLLIFADMAHPSPAPLPRSLRAGALRKLVDADVITLVGSDLYLVKALVKERDARERSNGGVVRSSTAERGPDGRFLPVDQQVGPALDQPVVPVLVSSLGPGDPAKQSKAKQEQSKDETSSLPRASAGPTGYPEGGRDSRDRYYELTMKRPWGQESGDWILRLEGDYGQETVTLALEAEHSADPQARTLLGRVEARLARDRDHREAAQRLEREQAEILARAGRKKATPEQLAEFEQARRDLLRDWTQPKKPPAEVVA